MKENTKNFAALIKKEYVRDAQAYESKFEEGKVEQKPKYMVSIAVNGRVDVEVEADNFEEAKKKACAEVCDLDFGSLECIDWHAVNAENEHGVFKDYGIEKGYVGLNEIIQSAEKESKEVNREQQDTEQTQSLKSDIEIG